MINDVSLQPQSLSRVECGTLTGGTEYQPISGADRVYVEFSAGIEKPFLGLRQDFQRKIMR